MGYSISYGLPPAQASTLHQVSNLAANYAPSTLSWASMILLFQDKINSNAAIEQSFACVQKVVFNGPASQITPTGVEACKPQNSYALFYACAACAILAPVSGMLFRKISQLTAPAPQTRVVVDHHKKGA